METVDEPLVDLLRGFLSVQSRRASIYNKLNSAFIDYLENGGEIRFQEICNQITADFNDCSRQVIKIEDTLRSPPYNREDLAQILHSVQIQEKQKLHMTAQLQVLKKAGRPSERIITHDQCGFENKTHQHHCIHVHKISVADGLEDAEAESEYNVALNEAIKGVQDAVIVINEHIEEIRYEIDDIESKDKM